MKLLFSLNKYVQCTSNLNALEFSVRSLLPLGYETFQWSLAFLYISIDFCSNTLSSDFFVIFKCVIQKPEFYHLLLSLHTDFPYVFRIDFHSCMTRALTDFSPLPFSTPL